jgi:tRNA(fMet)-specific endonuclease VapC
VGLLIPSVVLEELTYGFMKGERQQFNERKLQQIIQRLGIDIIDVNTNVARKYGFIYLSLERKGMRIPVNDVWIAASCMEVGGTLLTRDRHFAHLEQIDVMIV